MAANTRKNLLYSIPLIGTLLSSNSNSTASASASSSSDIHDILPYYNLPKGILPNVPNSYVLSPVDGSFTVEMEHPCYVKIEDQLVYYNKVIKGKLNSGQISHVSGIQARMFFIWVSVSGMDMVMESNKAMVDFHVGAFSHKLPAKLFESIPTCLDKACSTSSSS